MLWVVSAVQLSPRLAIINNLAGRPPTNIRVRSLNNLTIPPFWTFLSSLWFYDVRFMLTSKVKLL